MPATDYRCPSCGQIRWTGRDRSVIEEPSGRLSIRQAAGSPAWKCDSCGFVVTRKSAIARALEALDQVVPKTP